MNEDIQLYLASASPRRRELLLQIGLRFERISGEVDETAKPNEKPEVYVQRLALAKARAGQTRLGGRADKPVLGADTTVVIDQTTMFGKPRDREHGLTMLAQLSGREHQVLSAVALVQGERESVAVQSSQVHFRDLTAAECEVYWASGEPADKAGAYAIQGLGATFVTELHGSHSGVMGLPLFETSVLLVEFGIDLLAAYRQSLS